MFRTYFYIAMGDGSYGDYAFEAETEFRFHSGDLVPCNAVFGKKRLVEVERVMILDNGVFHAYCIDVEEDRELDQHEKECGLRGSVWSLLTHHMDQYSVFTANYQQRRDEE